MTKLVIDSPHEELLPDGMRRVSASIGKERLWFDLPPDRPATVRGEPFVVAALLPAMITGQSIVAHHDLPICPQLRTNLDQLQSIFRLWGRAMDLELRPVGLELPLAPAPIGSGTGTFLFGGVDDLFTWFEAPGPRPQVAFVRGVAHPLASPVYHDRLARQGQWFAQRGTTLLPMGSNIREVGRAFGLGWHAYSGAALAALAHAAGFSTTYVAASRSWSELWPNGSHPATDPLWSSATHQIVHHGNGAAHWQKLERLSREPGTLDLLQVCADDGPGNCGSCGPCLRTVTLLRILGLSSAALPPLEDLRRVARRTPADRGEIAALREAQALARRRGNIRTAAALGASLRRGEIRRVLHLFREGFFGGFRPTLER
jgi:hypothetical protein